MGPGALLANPEPIPARTVYQAHIAQWANADNLSLMSACSVALRALLRLGRCLRGIETEWAEGTAHICDPLIISNFRGELDQGYARSKDARTSFLLPRRHPMSRLAIPQEQGHRRRLRRPDHANHNAAP